MKKKKAVDDKKFNWPFENSKIKVAGCVEIEPIGLVPFPNCLIVEPHILSKIRLYNTSGTFDIVVDKGALLQAINNSTVYGKVIP